MISSSLGACQGLAVSHTTTIFVPAFYEVLIIENCHFYGPVVCLSEATSWGKSQGSSYFAEVQREREAKITPWLGVARGMDRG